MKKENHIVLEIINRKINYVCELSKVFKTSKYKYAFDKNNFPLKTGVNNYWNFLVDIENLTTYTWSQFNKKYDKKFSIKE